RPGGTAGLPRRRCRCEGRGGCWRGFDQPKEKRNMVQLLCCGLHFTKDDRPGAQTEGRAMLRRCHWLVPGLVPKTGLERDRMVPRRCRPCGRNTTSRDVFCHSRLTRPWQGLFPAAEPGPSSVAVKRIRPGPPGTRLSLVRDGVSGFRAVVAILPAQSGPSSLAPWHRSCVPNPQAWSSVDSHSRAPAAGQRGGIVEARAWQHLVARVSGSVCRYCRALASKTFPSALPEA